MPEQRAGVARSGMDGGGGRARRADRGARQLPREWSASRTDSAGSAIASKRHGEHSRARCEREEPGRGGLQCAGRGGRASMSARGAQQLPREWSASRTNSAGSAIASRPNGEHSRARYARGEPGRVGSRAQGSPRCTAVASGMASVADGRRGVCDRVQTQRRTFPSSLPTGRARARVVAVRWARRSRVNVSPRCTVVASGMDNIADRQRRVCHCLQARDEGLEWRSLLRTARARDDARRSARELFHKNMKWRNKKRPREKKRREGEGATYIKLTKKRNLLGSQILQNLLLS